MNANLTSVRALYLSCAAISALTFAFPAMAQDNPASEGAGESDNVIVVTGSIRDSLENATGAKRAALNVTDVATANSVGRFPDENIAAALARLPGVAVQLDQGQARYIQVRGAPNRWTSVSIDGLPQTVAALLQGIDVIAMARWGKAPDLVLSGPNEGQNVGAIILSSGTVSAAQYAAVMGIPAIALSAGTNTEAASLDNPLSDEVARRSVELVAALEAKANGGALLAAGLALNVNFPDTLEAARWQLTEIGNYNAYKVGFTANMAASASPMMQMMVKARGLEIPPLPGVSFDFNTAAPAADQMNDESVVYGKAIAVSPMQAGYAYRAGGDVLTRDELAAFLPKD